MPATAKFYVTVNGGANQDEGIDVPSDAVIHFVPQSISGWTRQRWEIFDYPEGWATPAGWNLDSDGTIYSTDVSPPDVTLPNNGTMWGVWMLRLLVNEQIDTDENLGALLDEANALSLLSPSGLRDMGARELAHFTSSTTRVKKWLRSYQRNLRTLENPYIPGVTLGSTPQLIRRYPIADSTARAIRAVVTVHNADATKHGEYEVKAFVKRVGGTLSVVYAPIVTTVFETDAGLDVTVTLNGNTDVDINVVGLAATPLLWKISEFIL